MTIKPLNYCRDMVNQLPHFLNHPQMTQKIRITITNALAYALKSQKFLLPEYGRFLDDDGLKALADDDLNLPFETIALEYHYPPDHIFVPPKGWQQCSKRILIATMAGDCILIWRVQYADEMKLWVPAGPVALPISNSIDRRRVGPDGRCCLTLSGQIPDEFDPNEWMDNFADDVWVLLSFLNALACTNVTVEKLQPPAPIPGRQPKKNAKLADVYHVLTLPIDPTGADTTASAGSGSYTAKREHLRRGHIRRLSDGRKLWINAMVINAGHGFGRVFKDYQMKTGGKP